MDWTAYEELMQKSEFAELTAMQYAQAGDTKLSVFYMKVAWCYKHRAENLKLGEAYARSK